ncbi:hypothetical protein WJ60_25715 [Burkholderia ubonensis]|uniref:hypothetical protein n=1 Tax=Burkholderia ubonensis TaxID=101571 RepID=UPI000754BE19|nr:hypothetical protein [Burkholderia ubonensis]KVM81603.1 hypothetical protein WJ60_25715 [Burkholderia ubonensis]
MHQLAGGLLNAVINRMTRRPGPVWPGIWPLFASMYLFSRSNTTVPHWLAPAPDRMSRQNAPAFCMNNANDAVCAAADRRLHGRS